MKKLLFFTCSFLLLQTISAQEENIEEKLLLEANKHFRNENFLQALPLYLQILRLDSTDVNVLFKAGVCYLQTNTDKSKAVPLFERLLSDKPENPLVYLMAGTAYQFDYQFDKAVTTYLFYLTETQPSDENTELVKRKIESCENAKELMKFPRNVTFENLGPAVNSPYPDYYPFIPLDETFVLFNSKRKWEGREMNAKGYYPSDVFISYVKRGKFQPARILPAKLNSETGNEDVVGLSGNGHLALFFLDNESVHGDIYAAVIKGDKIDSLTLLPPSINAPGSIEAAASLSADGRTIYFSSNRPGGLGGFDIYVTRLLPTGNWSLPENLGPAINTVYDEDFPNISPDNNTLYFSSKGHTSMGGFDIFTASRDEERGWTRTKNMGIPINTPADDMNFRVSSTGRYGYLSTVRPEEGLGDIDIYRITFNEVSPSFTVIKGNIYNTSMQKINSDVFISVEDQLTSETYGEYVPNPITGRYIIILPPGKYKMTALSDSGKSYMDYLDVYDKGSYVPEIDKNIILK